MLGGISKKPPCRMEKDNMKYLQLDLRPYSKVLIEINDVLESSRHFRRVMRKVEEPCKPLVEVAIIISALYYNRIDDMCKDLWQYVYAYAYDEILDGLDAVHEDMEYHGYIDNTYKDDVVVAVREIKSMTEFDSRDFTTFDAFFNTSDREEIADILSARSLEIVEVLQEEDLLSIDAFIELCDSFEKTLSRARCQIPEDSTMDDVIFDFSSYVLRVPITTTARKSVSIARRFKAWQEGMVTDNEILGGLSILDSVRV